MANMFKCRADSAGYCTRKLKNCCRFEACEYSEELPCQFCIASLPKKHPQCEHCDFKDRKEETYA